MFSRIFVLISILSLSLPASSQDKPPPDPDKPPVIAMTAIANFTYPQEYPHDIMAIRDKVVSDLVRNYECVVISRSNGFALATENALGKMNAISGGSAQIVGNIPAADFAITGYFKNTKQEQGKATLGCTLIITDLHVKSKADFQKADFIPSEDTNFSADITAKIVEMLKLKPKKKLEPANEALDETWAILPVSHLESLKQMREPADRSLAMSMELALQESKKVKKIVDHNEIDKVLQELKISSLSGATESLAGNIAGIVGADRVVIGTVSRSNRKNDNLRLDLLLVDGKKAVVLDSASVECKNDELEKTSSKQVLQLTQQHHKLIFQENATKVMRTKEFELYKETIRNIKYHGWCTAAAVDFAISLAEAAYMIISDDSTKLFEISIVFHDDFLCMYGKYHLESPLESPQIKKTVDTINKLLQPEAKFSKPQYPLIIRADSYRLLGDYDTALDLINKHISQYPDTERDYAFSVLGIIYYSKKEYRKAEECLPECKSNQLGVELGLNFYKGSGNEKKELEYLKEQRTHYWDVARCLQLIRKLEGPKAVIEYSNRRPLYSNDTDRPEVQLEFAKTYMELGDKRKALVILENINNEAAFKDSMRGFKDPSYKEKIKSEIQDLIKQLGPIKTEWKKASEIVKIPDKYKIYIQPIEITDFSMIQNAIPRIEEFWGIRVEILPVLPLPEGPYSFNKEIGLYNADFLFKCIIRTSKSPEDSIYTSYIINQDTWYDPDYFEIAANMEKHTFFTESLDKLRLRGAGNIYMISDSLSKSLSRSFASVWRENKSKNNVVEAYRNKTYFGDCDNFLCPISSPAFPDQHVEGDKDKKPALCEACQRKLKKVNFDELYAFWQNTLKPEKVTDPEEKKWVENYRIKVQEALKKAEADKIRKAQEKTDFIPSLEVADAKPGISCAYYEFENDKVKSTNQLAELQPLKNMTPPGLSIDSIERKENFGLIFSGFIKVPADDVYTFYLSSDDGSTLTVNDSKIVDDDGIHDIETKTGTIALKAGLHPIRLAYIQGVGGKFLELYWRSEKHLLGQKIPNEVLFHK